MGVMFITHDLGVIAQTADNVAVMYLGAIVEKGPVRGISLKLQEEVSFIFKDCYN